jgi:hypothetical protein
MAMMTWMRRVAPYLLAAVLLAFVVSLAYFGSSGGSGGSGAQAAVVTVDGDVVSAVAFDRAYRAAVEQTRQMVGERWTEDLPRTLRLRDQVAERLIEERLVAHGAAREGIAVSDAELAEQIVRIPAFQEGGRFSQDRYVRILALAQPPMSPADFEAELREELVRQRLQAFIVGGAKVTDAEVRQAWEAERSRVRAAYVRLVPGTGRSNPPSSPSPSAAASWRPSSRPPACPRRPSATPTWRPRTGRARASSSSRPGRASRTSWSRSPPWAGAPPRTRPRPAPTRRSAASAGARTSPRSPGRCRRTRRPPAAAATSASSARASSCPTWTS